MDAVTVPRRTFEDLALTLKVDGLFLPGSPVVETTRSALHECPGIVVPSASREGGLAIRWHGKGMGMETGITYGATLNLYDPTGAFHALLYLQRRGRDLSWAEAEPDLLAWSVLSVSRGGAPLKRMYPWWCELGSGWLRQGAPGNGALCVGRAGEYAQGWQNSSVPGETTIWLEGPEVDEEGKALADASALADNCALLSADGSFLLPPLPEASRE